MAGKRFFRPLQAAGATPAGPSGDHGDAAPLDPADPGSGDRADEARAAWSAAASQLDDLSRDAPHLAEVAQAGTRVLWRLAEAPSEHVSPLHRALAQSMARLAGHLSAAALSATSGPRGPAAALGALVREAETLLSEYLPKGAAAPTSSDPQEHEVRVRGLLGHMRGIEAELKAVAARTLGQRGPDPAESAGDESGSTDVAAPSAVSSQSSPLPPVSPPLAQSRAPHPGRHAAPHTSGPKAPDLGPPWARGVTEADVDDDDEALRALACARSAGDASRVVAAAETAAEGCAQRAGFPQLARLAAVAGSSPECARAVLLLCAAVSPPPPAPEAAAGGVIERSESQRRRGADRRASSAAAFAALLEAVGLRLGAMRPGLLSGARDLLAQLGDALAGGRRQLREVLVRVARDGVEKMLSLGGAVADLARSISSLQLLGGEAEADLDAKIDDALVLLKAQLAAALEEDRRAREKDMFRAVVVCLELHDLGALLRVVSDPAFEKRAFDAQPVRDADGEAGVPDDWALVAAMHVAAAQGDMAVVQWLLKLGVPPSLAYSSMHDLTPSLFLAALPESVSAPLLWRMSPLHTAVVYERPEVLDAMLAAGARVEDAVRAAAAASCRGTVETLLRRERKVRVGEASWAEMRSAAAGILDKWGADRATQDGNELAAALQLNDQDVKFLGVSPVPLETRRRDYLDHLVQWAFGREDEQPTPVQRYLSKQTLPALWQPNKVADAVPPAPEHSMSLFRRLCACFHQKDFDLMHIALMAAIEDGKRSLALSHPIQDAYAWPALAAMQMAVANGEDDVVRQLLHLGVPHSFVFDPNATELLEEGELRPASFDVDAALLVTWRGSPALLAAQFSHVNVCRAFVAAGCSREEMLSHAIATSSIAVVRMLLAEHWGLKDVEYERDLRGNAALERVVEGFLGRGAHRLRVREFRSLGVAPVPAVEQQGAYLRQLLTWGLDRNAMWPAGDGRDCMQPLISCAISAGMHAVVELMVDMGVDLMRPDTRGRRPFLVAVEAAERGRPESLAVLTDRLPATDIARMLCPPLPSGAPAPRTRSGLELLPLVRLRAAHAPAAMKALDGLVTSTDSQDAAGLRQVMIDYRPVDVPNSTLLDNVDTLFEVVALEGDVDMAGHPVLSTLVECKWLFVYGRVFNAYLALYAMLLVALVCADMRRSAWTWAAAGLTAGHVAILALRLVSQGTYVVTTPPYVYDALDSLRVLANLLIFRRWYGRTLTATAAWRLGLWPDGGMGGWLRLPMAFRTSGYTPLLVSGLALEVAALILALASEDGLDPSLTPIHTVGFFLLGLSGAYFLSVTPVIGTFVFALQAIASNIAVFLGVEVALCLLFAGTMYVLHREERVAGFPRLLLDGVLLIIGMGSDIASLDPAATAISVVRVRVG